LSSYELKFTELLKQHNESLKKEIKDEPRKSLPHIAVLTFKIDVRELDNDGIMGEFVLSGNELKKYGMSNKAQIFVKGQSEADCIKKVKNILENIDARARN
jgi:hypothetical protein